MKITIEHENRMVVIEDKNCMDIQQTLYLITDSLKACGFHHDTVKSGVIDLADELSQEEDK